MLKSRKSKKAEMSIPIVLLVLATLILYVFSLFLFNSRNKEIEAKIYVTAFLNDIYSQEEAINFYVYEIIEKIETGSLEKQEFLQEFRRKLSCFWAFSDRRAVNRREPEDRGE